MNPHRQITQLCSFFPPRLTSLEFISPVSSVFWFYDPQNNSFDSLSLFSPVLFHLSRQQASGARRAPRAPLHMSDKVSD